MRGLCAFWTNAENLDNLSRYKPGLFEISYHGMMAAAFLYSTINREKL